MAERCAVCETVLPEARFTLGYPDGKEQGFCPDGACVKREVQGIVTQAPGTYPDLPTRDMDVVPETSEQNKEAPAEDEAGKTLDTHQPPSIQEQMQTLEPGERYRKGDPPKDRGVKENNDEE